MEKEEGRIRRLQLSAAQEYLAQRGGEAYLQYRADWERCGSTQTMPSRPLQLNIELTAACNLQCRMCYRTVAPHVRHGVLPLEDIRLLADQFREAEIPSLWLSGGEPLLHPRFTEVLQLLSATKPLDFWMVTNGLLLDEALCEAVLDSGLTWLSISIDAADASTYRAIRGGDYERLLANIEHFLLRRQQRGQRLPFLRVSLIDMPENHDQVQDFVACWSRRADIVDIQTLADYRDKPDEHKQPVARLPHYRCTAPFTLVSVTPSGDWIPCCNSFYVPDGRYTVHNTSLLEYWNLPWRRTFAADLKAEHYPAVCRACIESFSK